MIAATDAVSLMYFGLGADQVHSVIGEHSTSGSNYGDGYFDANDEPHEERGDAPFDPSHIPAHPTEAELAIIKEA